MPQNPVKQRLQSGQTCLGTFVFEFDTSGVARLIAEAGAEFVLYDMEHTGWSVETIRRLVASTPRNRVVPFVRVPAAEYDFLARVLDVGAMGIMVPMVESAEHAAKFADACRYPPAGRRGAAFTIAHDDYTGGDVPQKMQAANESNLLIAQIETANGLDNVEAIAAVDGIDVLWIGQYDLTTSLGIPGQFDHPRFQEALEHVVATANKHGKVAGYMACSLEEAVVRLKEGFRILAYHGDLWLYQSALRDGLARIRREGGLS